MLKNSLVVLAALLLSVTAYARGPESISPQAAEQIALDNFGAGSITRNRTGRYQGTPVHQIVLEHNGESFRVFVCFQGEVVRGLVSITIPQAEEIAIAEVGGGEALSTRLGFFDGVQVYRIEVDYNSSTHRVLIDTESGEVLRLQRARR